MKVKDLSLSSSTANVMDMRGVAGTSISFLELLAAVRARHEFAESAVAGEPPFQVVLLGCSSIQFSGRKSGAEPG